MNRTIQYSLVITYILTCALPLASGATKIWYHLGMFDLLLGIFLIGLSALMLFLPVTLSFNLAVLFYLVSANINLLMTLEGRVSCGCFRGFSVTPVTMLVISLCIVSVFYVFQSSMQTTIARIRQSRIAGSAYMATVAVIVSVGLAQGLLNRNIIPIGLNSILDKNEAMLEQVQGVYEVDAHFQQTVTAANGKAEANSPLNFDTKFRFIYKTLNCNKNYRESWTNEKKLTGLALTNGNKLLVADPINNTAKISVLGSSESADYYNIRSLGINSASCTLRDFVNTFSEVKLIVNATNEETIVAKKFGLTWRCLVREGVIQSTDVFDNNNSKVGHHDFTYEPNQFPIPTNVVIKSWGENVASGKVASQFTFKIRKMREMQQADNNFSASELLTSKSLVHDTVSSGGMVFNLALIGDDEMRQSLIRQFDGVNGFNFIGILQFMTFNALLLGFLYALRSVVMYLRRHKKTKTANLSEVTLGS